MIRDDQDVTEEWILRVDGREYGPANIDTLREWKAEGRVLPANEARLRMPCFGLWRGGLPIIRRGAARHSRRRAADRFDKPEAVVRAVTTVPRERSYFG